MWQFKDLEEAQQCNNGFGGDKEALIAEKGAKVTEGGTFGQWDFVVLVLLLAMHVWLKGSLLLLFVGLAFLCFLSHVSDWHVWNWSKAQVVNHGLASSHVWVKVDLPNLFVSIVEISSEANNQSLSWGQSEQTSRENRLPKVPTVSWQFSCSYLILGDKHMTRSSFRPDTVRQRIGGEGCHQLFLLRSVLGNMKG